MIYIKYLLWLTCVNGSFVSYTSLYTFFAELLVRLTMSCLNEMTRLLLPHLLLHWMMISPTLLLASGQRHRETWTMAHPFCQNMKDLGAMLVSYHHQRQKILRMTTNEKQRYFVLKTYWMYLC